MTSRRSPFNALLGFWLVILSAMLVLLTAVAILQYRWTNEASSAEEMRIGAELESLMRKWHGDLYGELSAVCIAMQVGPDSGARDTWKDYLERYVEWKTAAPHESIPYVYRNPDLVRDIYIWNTSGQGSPRLLRLNAGEKRIEPSDMPPDLTRLLLHLQANSSTLSAALRAWQFAAQAGASPGSNGTSSALTPGSTMITGWQFDAEIPAIVHPILQRIGNEAASSNSPVDWIVISVDRTVLQTRVLPELSRRYFGGLDGLDYRVAVVSAGAKPRALYQSDPAFGVRDLDSADSAMNIFGLPEASLSLVQGESRGGPSLRSTEWRSFIGPAWFPVMNYGGQPDPWFLELQHRSGPLQAVINRAKRRNLGMSAVVLALLAINMGVLIVSGYRAQSFAKLQMDFVASVSHELRTPLSAIFSAGENLKDGVIYKRADLAHYGRIVMSQSRQLMRHVDRILLFASIRSGKERYHLTGLDVVDIFRHVHRDIDTLVSEELRTIEEVVEPGLPPVTGDMFAVCECVENLITNAIKYSPPDRVIFISAALESTESYGDEVAISVEDHGMGISHSELNRIFEPFYRSPMALARQIHGTGLGLSVAKHLAEAMGGRLSVRSQLEVGSVFTLHLRIADKMEGEGAVLASRAFSEHT